MQQWGYRPAQTEAILALRAHGARRVADIGCGTGILADRIQRELAPEAIYGVDMSEGMLRQARRRSTAVAWLKAPAENLPFADGALDAVVTTSAFHFFDHPAALSEFHRVLAPGGMAAVVALSPGGPDALTRLLSHRLNPAHSPSPPALRRLFTDAGFGVVDQHRVPRPGWVTALSDLITLGIKAEECPRAAPFA